MRCQRGPQNAPNSVVVATSPSLELASLQFLILEVIPACFVAHQMQAWVYSFQFNRLNLPRIQASDRARARARLGNLRGVRGRIEIIVMRVIFWLFLVLMLQVLMVVLAQMDEVKRGKCPELLTPDSMLTWWGTKVNFILDILVIHTNFHFSSTGTRDKQ